jgi:hypothetical protein
VTWQETLWAELGEMDDLTQIKVSGAWIEEITHSISPALARHRRAKVHEVLMRPDMDPTTLAETIGSRRSTIKRLDEEARANQRERDRRAA